MSEHVHRIVPALVPEAELAGQHQADGRIHAVFENSVVGTFEFQGLQTAFACGVEVMLEFFDEVVAGVVRAHAGQACDLLAVMLSHHVGVERHVPEGAGKKIIEECPQHHRLAFQLQAFLLFNIAFCHGLVDGCEDGIGSHHPPVAVLPDGGGDARSRRRDAQRGVVHGGHVQVHEVGGGLGCHPETVAAELAAYQVVAGVDAASALGRICIEVVAAGVARKLFMQGAPGCKERNQKNCKKLFHIRSSLEIQLQVKCIGARTRERTVVQTPYGRACGYIRVESVVLLPQPEILSGHADVQCLENLAPFAQQHGVAEGH